MIKIDAIVKCTNFVMIDNKLVSRFYPPNLLNEKEWRLLFYLQISANYHFGTTNHGHNAFSKICPCGRAEYRRIIERLQELSLITVRKYPDPSKFTTTTVMMAPLFDKYRSPKVVVNAPKSGETMSFYKVHFCMVPTQALERLIACRTLNIDGVRLLIRLYRYNDSKLFGGIDSNVVRLENGLIFIHPRLLFELYLSKDECEYLIGDLIRSGYLILVDRYICSELFDCDSRLRLVHQGECGEKITILKPRYQNL